MSVAAPQGVASSVSVRASRPASRFYARNTAKLAARLGVQAELRADGSRLSAAQQVLLQTPSGDSSENRVRA